MRRKVILLIASFLVLLAVFGVYLALAGGGRGAAAHRRALRELSELSRQAPRKDSQAMEAWKGTEFRHLDRDKDGRLKAVYFAPQWERQDDGSYLLIEPSAVLYQPGGQRIHIQGQRGIIYVSTDEAYRQDRTGSTRFRIRKGKLEGSVTVLYDRATAAERTAPDQRPQDVMRITTQDIEIDNEELMLSTDSRVTVVSVEAEISGQGLSIRWNEGPEELRMLRLENGDYMKVYYVGADEGLFALPGGSAAVTPVEPPAVEGSRAAPPAPPHGAQPGNQAKPSETPDTPSSVAATSPPPGKRSPGSAAVAPDRRRRAQNIYRATFHDNVTVDQGARHIHGLDTLAIEFQGEGAWDDRQGGQRQQRASAAASPEAGGVPAAALAMKPASTPGNPPAASAPTGAEPVAAPSVQLGNANARSQSTAAPATQRAGGEPVLVKWTGPLVITPIGYTDAPSRKNVAVSGAGRRVVLSDSQATATCRSFSFRRPAQQGQLSGAQDSPVVLSMPNGEKVVCPVVRFDLQAGTAELAGAGYMTRPTEIAAAETQATPASPTTQPVDRIKWGKSVDIRLASDTGRRAGSAAAGQYIKEATFHGNVELVQATSGDYLRCQELTASLGRAGTRQFIEKAVATGGVQGRQEDQGISADRLTVNFAAAEQPRQGAYGRAVVRDMLAEGNVRVTGKQDAQDWQASADRLEADRPTGTAVLYGKPASMSRGQECISGGEMHLNEQEGSAKVAGAGWMVLFADRNLSGQKLSAPRPVEITWTRQMDYSDRLGVASFDGNVVLVSKSERMECDRRMRVLFQKPETQPAQRAADAASKVRGGESAGQADKPAGVLTLGARTYGGQLSRIYADDEVILTSLRQDAEGRLLGKAEMKGKGLVYDAIGRRMDVGKGILFIQDFRPPKPRQRPSEGQQPFGGEVASPSQTYFEWARSMRLVLDERMVTMVGDVWMRHYSGDKIVSRAALERDLKLPPWPQELPSGRASDLLCDNLVARFTESAGQEPPQAATAASQPAEDLQTALRLAGALDEFIATGSVLLADGLYEVTGERISYDRATDIVLVRGFLEGQPPTMATVTTRDPPGTLGGEWIRWYRRTNTWETGRISGAGARFGPPGK